MIDADSKEGKSQYAELTAAITLMLEEFRFQQREAIVSVERMKIVLETSKEIKDQLIILNGRVRQNSTDITVIKSSPSLSREYCDDKHNTLETRIREIEGRVPALVQYVVVAFFTGSVMAVASHFISSAP